MDALYGFGAATEAIAIAGLVAASYASTNLDNFVVLSAYCTKWVCTSHPSAQRIAWMHGECIRPTAWH